VLPEFQTTGGKNSSNNQQKPYQAIVDSTAGMNRMNSVGW